MGCHEWMPGLTQFGSYDRSCLRGDVLAGVTVAAYLVPQVMAYATLAGLSPVVGLWGDVATCAICHIRIVAPTIGRPGVH